MSRHTTINNCCCCCWWRDVCAADFPSAPDLTLAAAAQNLEWVPVTVQNLSLDSYSLSQDAGSTTVLLNMTVTAKLGVAGSITDVAIPGTSSGRRSLLSSTTSVYQVCHLYGRIDVTVLGIMLRRPALQCGGDKSCCLLLCRCLLMKDCMVACCEGASRLVARHALATNCFFNDVASVWCFKVCFAASLQCLQRTPYTECKRS